MFSQVSGDAINPSARVTAMQAASFAEQRSSHVGPPLCSVTLSEKQASPDPYATAMLPREESGAVLHESNIREDVRMQ
jgi:hypothetical protein